MKQIMKQILIGLITIMLIAIPTMAYAPHDCDLNNDEIVNFDDVINLVINHWGYHDYWNYADFNGDTYVNFDDVTIMVDKWGTKPVVSYTEVIHTEGVTIYRLYDYNALDWVINWSCIDSHIYYRYGHSDHDPYVCHHFSSDLRDSFINDFGYRGIYYVTDIREGHSYSAFLVGTNPLIKDNWVFIEPSTDGIITQAMRDDPYTYGYSEEFQIYVEGGRVCFSPNYPYSWIYSE